MTKTTEATTPPRRRSPVAFVADLLGGAAIAFIGVIFGLAILASSYQYSLINDGVCVSGPYDGITCDPNALTIATTAITGVTIFAWALTAGMFIVRLLQRRLAFYWPIIGIVVMVIGFWIGTYVVGLIAEKAS